MKFIISCFFFHLLTISVRMVLQQNFCSELDSQTPIFSYFVRLVFQLNFFFLTVNKSKIFVILDMVTKTIIRGKTSLNLYYF